MSKPLRNSQVHEVKVLRNTHWDHSSEVFRQSYWTIFFSNVYRYACVFMAHVLSDIFEFSSTEVMSIPEWEAKVVYGEVSDKKSLQIETSWWQNTFNEV